MINIKRRWLLAAAPSLAFFTAAKQLPAASAIIPGDAVIDHKQLLREAVYLAQENRKQGGRPFGAVLTVDGRVVATGVNNIMQTHDIDAAAPYGFSNAHIYQTLRLPLVFYKHFTLEQWSRNALDSDL